MHEVEPDAGSLTEPTDEGLPAEGCPATFAVSVHEVETKLETLGGPEMMGETVTVVAAITTVLRSVSKITDGDEVLCSVVVTKKGSELLEHVESTSLRDVRQSSSKLGD